MVHVVRYVLPRGVGLLSDARQLLKQIKEEGLYTESSRGVADKPDMPKPSNAAQVQELRGVAPDKRAQVWENTVEANEGKDPDDRAQVWKEVEEEASHSSPRGDEVHA